MGLIIFGLFLLVPLIEIALFILMGQTFGLWPTLLGVVVTAMIGSFVIRRQGLSLLMEVQRLTGAGALPAKQIVEGVMLAVAGALLLTPGYFTDSCGFLLLVPAIRTLIYEQLKARVVVQGFAAGSTTQRPDSASRQGARNQIDPDIIDLDAEDWRDH